MRKLYSFLLSRQTQSLPRNTATFHHEQQLYDLIS
jgi:hypothetical protein